VKEAVLSASERSTERGTRIVWGDGSIFVESAARSVVVARGKWTMTRLLLGLMLLGFAGMLYVEYALIRFGDDVAALGLVSLGVLLYLAILIPMWLYLLMGTNALTADTAGIVHELRIGHRAIRSGGHYAWDLLGKASIDVDAAGTSVTVHSAQGPVFIGVGLDAHTAQALVEGIARLRRNADSADG
jgi:hypothetical protein